MSLRPGRTTLVDDRKALAAEIAFDKAREHDTRLTAKERESWHAKELAARKQLEDLDKKAKSSPSESRDQIREFFSEFPGVVSSYAPNYFDPKLTSYAAQQNTHLYEMKNHLYNMRYMMERPDADRVTSTAITPLGRLPRRSASARLR
jgi:hypothetical protein